MVDYVVIPQGQSPFFTEIFAEITQDADLFFRIKSVAEHQSASVKDYFSPEQCQACLYHLRTMRTLALQNGYRLNTQTLDMLARYETTLIDALE
jgi:hypothetical protein